MGGFDEDRGGVMGFGRGCIANANGKGFRIIQLYGLSKIEAMKNRIRNDFFHRSCGSEEGRRGVGVSSWWRR